MFELFEVVRIKSNGVIGTIVDKTEINGKVRYIVESDSKGEFEGAYGGEWPLFDCVDADIVGISKKK